MMAAMIKRGSGMHQEERKMNTRKLLLGIATALLLAIGPAYAAPCIHYDAGDRLTLQGQIEQGPPHKSMTILLGVPLCGSNNEAVELGPVARKWEGLYVIVEGIIETGPHINVHSIVADKNKHACPDRRIGRVC
jgi:hypothetical protein